MNKSSIIILAFSVTLFAGGPGAEKFGTPKKLANVGNSCFMNAALQCLYNMTEFTDAILATPPKFYKPKSIAELYKNLLKELRETNKDVIEPIEFCPAVSKAIGQAAGTQGDVKAVVDLLFQHLLKDDLVLKDDLEVPPPAPYAPLIEYTIIIKDTYSNGNEKSRVSSPLIPNFLLSGDDFKSSFTDFTTPTDFPTPKNFDDVVIVQRISKFTKAGRYFVCTKAFGKIKPFPFPTKFDLGEYSEKSTLDYYDLISFAIHYGKSDQSGHYVAYVKKNNTWFYCSDTVVKEVKGPMIERYARRGYEESMTNLPILLIYERQITESPTLKNNLLELEQDLSALSAQIKK